MNPPKQKIYRKRHLFARSLDEVVKQATKPMMDKQGKLYSALLRDWPSIVGAERAMLLKPDRLQFPTHDASGATLHLQAHPAHAPELAYAHEQLLEQCARYFGYRAIVRIVFHPDHRLLSTEQTPQTQALPTNETNDMRALLQELRARIMSDTNSNGA